MNFLLITLLAVGAVSFFPRNTFAASSDKDTEEQPRALPLTAASGAAAAPADVKQSVAGEIWQEDDHEILIRSERGAKNSNGGPSSGKEKKQRRPNANSRKLAESNTEQKSEQKIEHNKNEHKNEHKNRVAKKPSTCRYEKSPWTDCDQSSNMRSRTLTLKKGDDGCVPTRTIQKKCKKACRYEKGEWSKCVNGQMTRTDNVKAGFDPSCKQTREVNKNCSKDKKQKKQDKNGRNKSRA